VQWKEILDFNYQVAGVSCKDAVGHDCPKFILLRLHFSWAITRWWPLYRLWFCNLAIAYRYALTVLLVDEFSTALIIFVNCSLLWLLLFSFDTTTVSYCESWHHMQDSYGPQTSFSALASGHAIIWSINHILHIALYFSHGVRASMRNEAIFFQHKKKEENNASDVKFKMFGGTWWLVYALGLNVLWNRWT